MAVGRGGFIAGSSRGTVPLTPTQETARIEALRADTRRHLPDSAAEAAANARTPAKLPIVADGTAASPSFYPRGGATLAFLAQHIAQEVEPEDAGPTRHASAAYAYVWTRDITTEVLPHGTGFDIQI